MRSQPIRLLYIPLIHRVDSLLKTGFQLVVLLDTAFGRAALLRDERQRDLRGHSLRACRRPEHFVTNVKNPALHSAVMWSHGLSHRFTQDDVSTNCHTQSYTRILLMADIRIEQFRFDTAPAIYSMTTTPFTATPAAACSPILCAELWLWQRNSISPWTCARMYKLRQYVGSRELTVQ